MGVPSGMWDVAMHYAVAPTPPPAGGSEVQVFGESDCWDSG